MKPALKKRIFSTLLAGALLQPAVGMAMDAGWDGTLVEGVRMYSVENFRHGIALLAGAAFIGAVATFFLRETGCRNIWQAERPATT